MDHISNAIALCALIFAIGTWLYERKRVNKIENEMAEIRKALNLIDLTGRSLARKADMEYARMHPFPKE